MTLFVLIIIFIFKFIIIIIINVDVNINVIIIIIIIKIIIIIIIIIFFIIIFKKFIIKLIIFRFNMKMFIIINILFNQFYNYTNVEIIFNVFLRINDNYIIIFRKNKNKTFIIKTLNDKNEIKFLTFKEKINDNLNKTLNNIFQKKNRFDINIIYRFINLNIMNKIIIIKFI